MTASIELQPASAGTGPSQTSPSGIMKSVSASATPFWIKGTSGALLLLGMLLTSWTYQNVRNSAQQRTESEFDQRVDEAMDEVSTTLHTHATLLVAMQGLFRGSTQVSRIDFNRFIQSMRQGGRNSNVLAQTWNPMVQRDSVASFEAIVRADDSLHEEGYPDFRVSPPPLQANAFVVTYAEPMIGNEMALGFDLGSNPARRAAVEQARDTGKLIATAPIALIRDDVVEKGYLLILPVYGPHFPEDIHERREHFTGVVVAVFRVGDLIDASGNSEFGAIQAWDTTEDTTTRDRQLLYVSGKPGTRLHVERQLAIGGRTWRLRIEHLHSSSVQFNELMIAFMGILATLLATALFALLATSRQRALAQASRLTLDLQKANEELNRSNADLSQFAHVASHDLQTPVRNVISAVDLLEEHLGSSADDDTRELLGYLQKSATRMRKLVQDLLDYAKVGRNAIHLAKIELDEVLQEVIKATSNLCRETDSQLIVDQLPAIMGDADQLERVFLNLTTNAIKYGHPDRNPVIRISCKQHAQQFGKNECIQIRVSDNGQGIEEQYHDTVFQPFKRLHSHDDVSGTGLGLGICKQIIERHRGSISIESSNSSGTTFLISLPQSTREPQQE